MSGELDTVLLAVTHSNAVKIGLPPRDRMDSFNARAQDCGQLDRAKYVFCSPDGEVYCIRDNDLYVGPMPSSNNPNWFSTATRVGRFDWGRMKLMCFHPKGDLYVVTNEGNMYRGPKPKNENVSWLYGQATKIGGGWGNFATMFFDSEGSLHVVTNDDGFHKGPAPEPNSEWFKNSTKIGQNGWCRLTHFMSFSHDGKLWCIDKYNGNLYRGAPPTPENTSYLHYADALGWDYHQYKFLSFTKDKTVHKIISFKFLPEKGKTVSETPEVIAEEIYDNRKSSSPLKHEFTFTKMIKQSSSFEHEHGFTFAVGMEATFKSGVPLVAEGETKITVNMSTTHNWKFTETNETEITFSSSSPVEIEAGKAVKVKATVVSSQIDVPYQAEVLTMFGQETCIEGKWKGVSHYNMKVEQEDYKG